MTIIKPIKRIFTLFLLFLMLIALYISTAFLLTYFPSKGDFSINKEEKIYIIYDNIHSDIAFNLKDISDDWIKDLPIIKNRTEGYISFGWGDKETYLNTPTWDKIKVSTSLKALFINTPSLMHVSYYPDINYFIGVKSLKINKKQSKKIKKSIFKSFNFKEKYYRGYGNHDLFYNSPYQYNLLHTCNTWTGNTLRDANIPISYWTPFSKNVINSID